MESKYESRITSHESRIRTGSALILAVVLTSLLAIVGVMFVMVARVDRIATSAISENKTLDSAVEAVIARISQELVLDVPRLGQEYYDYPDAKNAWLASLEPHKDGGYKWRRISDVYDRLGANLELDAEIIPDHQDDVNEGLQADADGDGVADSKWIELEGINSSKGKTIFAAIRVIDNGAMLNVNTAYKFDPTESRERIDGSSQMQINLMALAGRPGYTDAEAEQLLEERTNYPESGLDPDDLDEYEKNVVWRYNEPNGPYTPFDISDDLELRNRFLVNHEDMRTRIERLWTWSFNSPTELNTPVDSGGIELDRWFYRTQHDVPGPNDIYSYRHIGTTYNIDRIINPYGGRMVNVNKDGAGLVYNAIKTALFTADPNFKDVDRVAAQTAVNLIDFRDDDPNITTLDVNGITYYGFERPCVYISELAHKFVKPYVPPGLPRPAGYINRSYAIELHKPYPEDKYPDANNRWQLSIEGYPRSPIPVDWSGTQRFHVMLFEHQNVPLEDDVDFDLTDKDPNFDPSAEKTQTLRTGTIVFAPGKTISLERRVGADWISVDSVTVQYGLGPPYKVWDVDGQVHSYQRDIKRHKCIRRLWDDFFEEELSETLGSDNGYTDLSDGMIQAHPENRPFTNVGEIGMVFREDVYRRNWDDTDTEADVRLDLADPNYHNIFKYLTVFDPSRDFDSTGNPIDNDSDGYENETDLDKTPELKIPGRININTAPWYVIAQLPWVSYDENDKANPNYSLAQAIVAYRDKLKTPVDYSDPNTGRYDVIQNKIPATVDQDDIREEAGFASIGELALVLSGSKDEYNEHSIDRFSKDDVDLGDFPDLTLGGSTADGAEDDFEERDVIFARISNLVTVRSDIFTAYILVRIGADGPQKRVMAILDRSNVYPPEGGKVRIVALHAVADPR